jgi:signal transduction histidine kinase
MTWGHRHGRHGRPPWWPQNEPFPPPGGWQGVPLRFRRRFALGFALFFALTFLASGLAVALLSGAFGARKGLLIPAAFLGLLLLGGAFAISMRFVRRMARPVGDVMEAADRLAAGDYTTRVEPRGPRELRRLGRSFNTMAERLESAETSRRNLLADLAHELRTPLSVIRGDVEAMLDGVYPSDRGHLEPLLDETTVMARLLDDLQTLSRAEAGVLTLHRQAIEPSELVEDAAASFRGTAGAARLELRSDADPGLPAVEADPVRIAEVFANLLSNAVRHSPAGGTVTLSARTGSDGVDFSVEDTGPGIAQHELAHVFDRFVKSPDSTGAGLGLAIARSLVVAHGGSIVAERRPEGGTRIRFTLPTTEA